MGRAKGCLPLPLFALREIGLKMRPRRRQEVDPKAQQGHQVRRGRCSYLICVIRHLGPFLG